MNDDDPRHFIDLHESQWTHEKKREPILGEDGGLFLILFVLAFPVTAIMTLLVTGELPYYLRNLLQ